MIVVTNPVDVLTHIALQRSGWPRGRVIGSGTVLDSYRLRYLLAKQCGVDVHNVHAYVFGEHGDSEFVPWSMAHIAGMQIDAYCPVCRKCPDGRKTREEIEETVRRSAYHIIDYKGATYFAVGLALVKICGSILRGQRSVLTVSSRLDGEFGIEDVCLGVPCLLSGEGVDRIIVSELPEHEQRKLAASADTLKRALAELNG